jgi:hypothetical protein
MITAHNCGSAVAAARSRVSSSALSKRRCRGISRSNDSAGTVPILNGVLATYPRRIPQLNIERRSLRS